MPSRDIQPDCFWCKEEEALVIIAWRNLPLAGPIHRRAGQL